MSRLINLLINVFLQIKITMCYNYLNRNSYEQTDQSAHNFFTSNNENTALRLFKMNNENSVTYLSVHNFSSSNNDNTVLSLFTSRLLNLLSSLQILVNLCYLKRKVIS